jgi:glycosyltransferase involved in cell wall biosynthesis
MLTVFLATRNRADLLRNALNSFCNLQVPLARWWKVVVIDNCSTDNTEHVVRSFMTRLPVVYIFCEARGKNFALNAGLKQGDGDLYVFTDDDVIAHPKWLLELRKAADEHDDYMMFGGKVIPHWESEPPEWMRYADMGPTFTLTGDCPEGEINPRLVFGPNMAVRARAFAELTFDTTIGPSGTSYAMGSETDLLIRLANKGYKAYHTPGAIVEHFIRKEQMDRKWIMRRAVRYGRGQYRMNPRPKLWWDWFPRHLIRDIPLFTVRMWSGDPEQRFRAEWRRNMLIGNLIEATKTFPSPRFLIRSLE